MFTEVEWGAGWGFRGGSGGEGPEGIAPWLARGPPKAGLATSFIIKK